MKKHLKSALFLAAGLGFLAACGTSSNTMRHEITDRLGDPVWMVEREIPADPFSLTVRERMHERFTSANIYIEGDGIAWLSKRKISRDPTPKNPVALHLATRDQAENVAWLSRPCQYSGVLAADTPCDSKYWSGERFSPEVLQAYNAALDEMKARYDLEGFNLIGFSGGGAVAALLAAQRDDVLSLRTVAGNVDHKAHSHHHEVSMLNGSLNPPDFSAKLKAVPQYHFIGGQDEIVPPAILHSYIQSLGQTNCVQYKLVQEAEHEEGWVDKWPALLSEKPLCRGPIVEPMDDFVFPEPIKIQRELPKGK